MTRITNADQVLLLLRSHLERSGRSRRKGGAAKTANSTPSHPTSLQRVQEIAQAEALSDDDIKRTLISCILIDEFGPDVVNDAKFQDVINDVTRVLNQNSKGRRLLDLSVKQLRAGG